MKEYIRDIANRIVGTAKTIGKKTGNEIAGFTFACVLVLVFACNLIIPDRGFSPNENRMLQEFPKLGISNYLNGSLEKKFEDYSNDQFMLRDVFIRIKSAFDVASGNIKANGVWKGHDGYLIEDAEVPSDKLLEEDIAALAKFREDNSKLKMRFMLVPNAVSIMEDKLPLGANPADQNKYIDDFYKSISELGYETVDVRDEFSKAADEGEQLYYYTDHHWTSVGAELAFGIFREQTGIGDKLEFTHYPVKTDFIGTLASRSGFASGRSDTINLPANENNADSVIYFEDSQVKTTRFYQLDKLDSKDAYQVFGGNNHSIYTIKTPVKNNRRLLLIKDSYANSMIPYLTQYYTEIIVVDPRYYYDEIQDEIDIEGVTSVLFLYNANTFFGDTSLKMMLNENEE